MLERNFNYNCITFNLLTCIVRGVTHLHGYRVADDDNPTRRFGIQLIPPHVTMRTYQFAADNETDFKRYERRSCL